MDVQQHDYWQQSTLELDSCTFKGISCKMWWLPVLGTSGGGLIIVIVVAVYCYRRRLRLQIFRQHWKIPTKSFKIIDNPSGGVKTQSKAHKYAKRRNIDSYILMGSTKAEYIELIQRHKIEFKNGELALLMELKKASHDNIAKFLGIHYNESSKFLFIHTFVDRATLHEVLRNLEHTGKKTVLNLEGIDPMDPFIEQPKLPDDEMSVDMMFKSGFIHDIIKGLTYLHKTIAPHGWLSTHTCLIDSNWVLKLANFGVGNLLHKFTKTGALMTEKIIPFSHYVAIAPEHLKDLPIGHAYPLGTVEGDIYSLGIIACQVLFDTDPYTDSLLLTQDILQQIGEGILTPQVPLTTNAFEEGLANFIQPCFHPTAKARSTLRVVGDSFNKVFHKSRGNLVDQMLIRNMQYANQLESIVNHRTQELTTAQQTTYKLLCELLPKLFLSEVEKGKVLFRSVAETMRMGIKPDPRSYESATVLFCQICNFQHFLNHCSAEQVRRLKP
ncbi:hypothetical protein L596_024796 [Steinernema carpocapsae]|uniref:guanylate cyclase n=1 Tax=Steinernema carpocapsae TaxID=34508 RepID=A0A4V5ZYL6_STECR|nr:hypothetical protein L596_024796 [Steinernema carpocapsae]